MLLCVTGVCFSGRLPGFMSWQSQTHSLFWSTSWWRSTSPNLTSCCWHASSSTHTHYCNTLRCLHSWITLNVLIMMVLLCFSLSLSWVRRNSPQWELLLAARSSWRLEGYRKAHVCISSVLSTLTTYCEHNPLYPIMNTRSHTLCVHFKLSSYTLVIGIVVVLFSYFRRKDKLFCLKLKTNLWPRERPSIFWEHLSIWGYMINSIVCDHLLQLSTGLPTCWQRAACWQLQCTSLAWLVYVETSIGQSCMACVCCGNHHCAWYIYTPAITSTWLMISPSSPGQPQPCNDAGLQLKLIMHVYIHTPWQQQNYQMGLNFLYFMRCWISFYIIEQTRFTVPDECDYIIRFCLGQEGYSCVSMA